MDILTLDISYKWNHIICGLLCLASFRVHSCCSMCQCFIPFYWQIFHCMDISYLFYPFISWWTFELFISFGYHKYTAMNVYKFSYGCMFSVLLGRITGSYDNCIFNFLRSCKLIQSHCTICILTNNVWGFPFLHIFTNTCYCLSSIILQFSREDDM